MNYDLIGDIHGHADELEALLRKLGYRERGGAWRQPGHTAVFVGDYIDRGPRQLETVASVRAMVDAGSALAAMGNHEFNALAWAMPDRECPGAFMRPHTPEKQRQHQAFLDATDGKPRERSSILQWFLTLPVWLELPPLRVVHACWDEDAMAALKPLLDDGNRLSGEGVHACARRGTRTFRALETVLKGPEVELPDGLAFRQGDSLRREARLCWWKPHDTGMRDALLVDRQAHARLPDAAMPSAPWPRYDTSTPIFMGHYWMTGVPAPLTPRIACLDYSVAKDGNPLVGYRWRGEPDIAADHFVAAR